MTTNFYNKVAKKFGNYHTDAQYIKEYQNGDPEEVFKNKLLELSGNDEMALDIGCADGRFTLSIATHFQKITAIDLSTDMLESARNLQKKMGIENVSFEEQNASKTTFAKDSFDLVYSRRGPTPFPEFHRLLKPRGHFVGINIGEKDCQAIKEIFGRGQGYGEWGDSKLEKDRGIIMNSGFEIVFAQNYFYNEFHASYEDLDLFLQGVPIFEDFDSKKDNKLLSEYVAEFKTENGIKLSRHRIVIVARKLKSSKE